jgi:hypothetical protein
MVGGSVRGRARADVQDRCDGVGSGESAERPLGPQGLWRAFSLRHSLVELWSGGLGQKNAKTARPVLPGAPYGLFPEVFSS